MSDLSVDMNRALTNEAYAASCIRRGCDANTRCQITAQWGADKVKAWESVDSTQYEIDDVSYSNAYNTSKQNVKDSVGYSRGKDLGAIGDAALSVAGTGALIYNVANVGLKTTVNASTKAAQAAKDAAKAAKTAADTAKDAAQKAANKAAQTAADETATETAKQSAQEAAETAQKAADKAQEASKEAADKASQETTSKNKGNTSAYIAAGIAIATAAKYTLEKPNKEQVRAANELLQNQLPESQGDLQNAQSDMLAASEEVTALTEEANEANEDANDKIEDDKTSIKNSTIAIERLSLEKLGENLVVKVPASANTLYVMDLHGKVLKSQNVDSRQANVNLQGFAKGSYILMVKTSNGLQSVRFLK